MLSSTKHRSVHGQAKCMHQYVSHLWIRQRIMREKAIHCCAKFLTVGLICIVGLVRDFTLQLIPFLPAIKPKSVNLTAQVLHVGALNCLDDRVHPCVCVWTWRGEPVLHEDTADS